MPQALEKLPVHNLNFKILKILISNKVPYSLSYFGQVQFVWSTETAFYI